MMTKSLNVFIENALKNVEIDLLKDSKALASELCKHTKPEDQAFCEDLQNSQLLINYLETLLWSSIYLYCFLNNLIEFE